MTSLKTNVVWNVVRVGANMLFPIITLPYINRVLGPYNIGLYNYINSIVAYFILFASLGFPLYGTREVTKYREDHVLLEDRINSIFTSIVVSSIIVMAFYLFFAICYHGSTIALCIILGLAIILNSISFDWFFQGIEDFKYVTVRSVIFKIISAAALFLLVKTRNDLLIYACINTFAIFGSNIVNCWKINHYLKLRLNIKGFKKNLKGASILFVGSIIASLYTQINSVMLGSLGSIVAVAYYTTGDRFIQICLQIMNSFSMAIMPRVSYMKNNNKNDNQSYILQKKVFNYILIITIPMTIGLFVAADDIIMVFAGDEFLPAISVLRYLSIIVVLIPLSIFFAFQVLYPIGKEKYSNYCTLTAALFNIGINIVLIPILSYKSVIISVIISELIVLLMHFYFSKDYIDIKILDFINLKILVAALLSGIVASAMANYVDFGVGLFSLTTKIMVIALLYPLLLILQKDNSFVDLLKTIKIR